MRSDDFWTGKISKNMLIDKTIEFINPKNTGTGVPTHILSTNKHALLSNIELRTMNEENNPGAGMKIIESEVELGKWRIVGENILIKKINPVTMTDMTASKGDIIESEISIVRQDSQLSNNLESPMGSFLSLNRERSSEKEEDEYITSMTNWVKILKFQDTLTDEDYRQFEIIYDSLLLEGKAGNLTKSILEVVLAQKPPAWLQVIHERLKHLIISSETFQNRKKRDIRLEEKSG